MLKQITQKLCGLIILGTLVVKPAYHQGHHDHDNIVTGEGGALVFQSTENIVTGDGGALIAQPVENIANTARHQGENGRRAKRNKASQKSPSEKAAASRHQSSSK